jgi:hypothetical protein
MRCTSRLSDDILIIAKSPPSSTHFCRKCRHDNGAPPAIGFQFSLKYFRAVFATAGALETAKGAGDELGKDNRVGSTVARRIAGNAVIAAPTVVATGGVVAAANDGRSITRPSQQTPHVAEKDRQYRMAEERSTMYCACDELAPSGPMQSTPSAPELLAGLKQGCVLRHTQTSVLIRDDGTTLGPTEGCNDGWADGGADVQAPPEQKLWKLARNPELCTLPSATKVTVILPLAACSVKALLGGLPVKVAMRRPVLGVPSYTLTTSNPLSRSQAEKLIIMSGMVMEAGWIMNWQTAFGAYGLPLSMKPSRALEK